MNEIKMSIICSIQALTSNRISFNELELLSYNELEKIRDIEIINYNNRIKGNLK